MQVTMVVLRSGVGFHERSELDMIKGRGGSLIQDRGGLVSFRPIARGD